MNFSKQQKKPRVAFRNKRVVTLSKGEYCEIFKNAGFEEHLRTSAS